MSNDFYGEHTKRVFQKWQDDKLAMTAVQMADNDPTLLPPPKYTKARADVVYDEPFRCAMEFVTYQRIPGDVLEFGTLNGYTARKLAELMAELGHPGRLMLFDSFQGMPSVPEQGLDLNSYEIRAGAWQPEYAEEPDTRGGRGDPLSSRQGAAEPRGDRSGVV